MNKNICPCCQVDLKEVGIVYEVINRRYYNLYVRHNNFLEYDERENYDEDDRIYTCNDCGAELRLTEDEVIDILSGKYDKVKKEVKVFDVANFCKGKENTNE